MASNCGCILKDPSGEYKRLNFPSPPPYEIVVPIMPKQTTVITDAGEPITPAYNPTWRDVVFTQQSVTRDSLGRIVSATYWTAPAVPRQ